MAVILALPKHESLGEDEFALLEADPKQLFRHFLSVFDRSSVLRLPNFICISQNVLLTRSEGLRLIDQVPEGILNDEIRDWVFLNRGKRLVVFPDCV